MPDREKVIKGLEHCEIGSGDRCYETECPYYEQECTESLKNDILELLKELEAVKPRSVSHHGANPQIQHFCGNCNAILFRHKQKYCFNCGRPVKWK